MSPSSESPSSDGMVKKAAIIAGAVIVVALLLMVVFKDKIAGSKSGVVQQALPSSQAEAEQLERRGAGANPAAADANARALASEKR